VSWDQKSNTQWFFEVFEINVTGGSLILDFFSNRVEQLVSERLRVRTANASQMLLHCSKSSSCRAKSYTSKGAWIIKKSSRNEQVIHIFVLGVKNTPKKSFITWECMSIILPMHEQTLNDPWPNITYPHHKYWMCIRTNKKGHKNVHLWSQWTWFLKICFFNQLRRGKRERNPNFAAHSWAPQPPPMTTSTKILCTFSLFGAHAIVMLLVHLSSWIAWSSNASSLLPLGCSC